jgi:fibronectin type 3 domain-containing protein
MKKTSATVGQVPETFSQKRRIPRLPLIIVAVAAGAVGVYALVNSFAAVPPAPTGKIYAANNAVGWGAITDARSQLGVNGDRTCHDEADISKGVINLASSGMRLTLCVNSEDGLTSLNTHAQDYANTVADQARTYGPGGTFWSNNSQYAAYAIQSFEIMNEPYGWWYRGGDNDPAAYAHLAAAAIRAGKAANPQAKFYIPLAPDDVKLKNGTWVDWNKALLAAEPGLFQLADGFTIHLYYTPSEFASILDAHKNWAWSQPGGNGKPFLITESNLTDQQASPEADYVAAMPQFVQIAQSRSWVKELFIFCWHGFSGRDYLGFVNSSGSPRQARIDAYRNAIQKALAAESPTPTPTPTPSDTTVPSVSLTAPISGATVSGASVAVSASASDNVGVTGVQFKLDGNNLGAEDTGSPYGVTWNTTGVTNGTHSLTAVARDAAGNSKISSAVSVTVNNIAPDTTPPDTTLTAKPASSTTSTSASFSFVSSEPNSTFSCNADAGNFVSCASPRSYSGLTPGTHTFTVRATDAAGNVDPTPATYTWTIVSPTQPDTTLPTVSFASPANGATVSGIVTATANAADNTAVAKVELSLDGSLKMTDTTAPYNYSFDSKTLINGSHTLTAKAFDAAGNSQSATITINVNNADTTPPNAPTGLTANAANATTVNLTWNAATDSGINATGVVKYNVLRNGVVIAQPTTTTYADTNRAANTTYSYTVQAVDGAGNTSANSNTATATTPVVADTTPPTTPAKLQAAAISSTQVNLSWSPSTDTGGSGLAGYNVYRNGNKINNSLVTTPTYGDSTVKPNTHYRYKVQAVDGAGNKSPNSNVAKVTTPRTSSSTSSVTSTTTTTKESQISSTSSFIPGTTSATFTVVQLRNKPVKGAVVTVAGQTSLTNRQGVAYFSSIPTGSQDVTVQYGDKQVSKTVKVKQPGQKAADIFKVSLVRREFNPALLFVPVAVLIMAGVFFIRPWDKKFASVIDKDSGPQIVSSNQPHHTEQPAGRKLEAPGTVYTPGDKDQPPKQ